MLTAAKKYGWSALIAVVSAWLLYVAIGSASFQICASNKENKQTEQSSKKNSSEVLRSLVASARVKTDCVFVVLYDSRDSVAAIATVFISVFTFTLWRSTNRLWEAGEKQIAVAKEAADAARDSVKLAGEIAQRQLRAYLSIEFAMRDGAHQLVPEFKAKIIVKNCGQTPAYNGTLWISLYASPQESPIPPELEGTTSTFEMPPGNAITVWPAIDTNKLLFFDEAIDGLEKGKVAFYIVGRANFKDAFDEKRWFNFRLRYDKKCFASGNLNIEEIKSN